MSGPDQIADYRPSGGFPELPEGVALALLYLIVEQDRSLTSRTNNQPVAAYLLDLYSECLAAAKGDRAPAMTHDGPRVRDVIQ
jgi:hypothetical protein